MSKHFLVILLLVSSAFISKAQKGAIEYGFQGGLNLNGVYSNSADTRVSETLPGINIGGNIKFYLSKNIGIKAMLGFERNGWVYGNLVTTDSLGRYSIRGNVDYKLNYLTLPLLAEYSFGDRIKINLNAGPFIGFLLSNKIEFKEDNGASSSHEETNVFTPLNFGLSTGAEVQIPLQKKIKFNIELRNSLGLSNIYKSAAGAYQQKTEVISILTGLTYCIN